MALDPRLECLPEHEGPAFRTWHLIMQTTMGKVTKPSTAGFQFANNDGKDKISKTIKADTIDANNKISLKPAEEYISLDSSVNSAVETESNNAKRKKSQSSDESSGGEEESVTASNLNFAPWKTKDYPENAYGLHLEIIDFYNYISPLPEEESMRNDVVKRMSNLILSIWPAAKVEVFGSFCTNLYLPTSDIDLAVFGKWEKLPLFTVEKALISNGIAEASSIKVLDKATVPIIKLTDKISKIHVDISFNTETSVKSAEMVKSYIKEFEILPYLFLVLKHFLVQRDLNEVFTGGISSYCLMLLAVSFLQRHPRADAHKGKDQLNLGVLLMEFFELYGRNFNYQNIGVKIRDGGRYISKEEIKKDLGDGEYPALLCIEDPVTLACDIGRSSYGILRVKETFEYAFNVVDSALRNKSYFKVNPNSTYLSRILSIPTDLINYRQWVQKKFDTTKTSIATTVISPPIYHVSVPQYIDNTRPPLLSTPSGPYSPHIPVATPPFSPYTTASTGVVSYTPVAFFANSNIPGQPTVLHPVTTTDNGTLLSSSEVSRLSNVHLPTVRNNAPHTLQLQQVRYVVSSVFNKSPVEKGNQPPTTPLFSPTNGNYTTNGTNNHPHVENTFFQGNYQTIRPISSNAYMKRYNSNLPWDNNFERKNYNTNKNTTNSVIPPKKASPRTNTKFNENSYQPGVTRSAPVWLRDNQNHSKHNTSLVYNTNRMARLSDYPPQRENTQQRPTANTISLNIRSSEQLGELSVENTQQSSQGLSRASNPNVFAVDSNVSLMTEKTNQKGVIELNDSDSGKQLSTRKAQVRPHVISLVSSDDNCSE